MSEIVTEDEYLELIKDGYRNLCDLGSYKLLYILTNSLQEDEDSYLIIDEETENIFKVSSDQTYEFLAAYVCGVKEYELFQFVHNIINNNIDL